MQETKIVPPQPWHTVARRNSCRDYKYFCRFIPAFLERNAAVMISGFRRTILCHYQNLSKIHYEVKRWKNGNCRSESKCINCTYFLPHKICISPRLAKTFAIFSVFKNLQWLWYNPSYKQQQTIGSVADWCWEFK